jgi:NAD-dependent deacetylase
MAPRVGSIAVLTGAGISAESGIATFRGAGGLWEGHRVEEVAHPSAWARDPMTVWRFYEARRVQGATCSPNRGHLGLAELERRMKGRFTLATQNVDGLHRQAGSQNLLELHGSLWRVRCVDCGLEVENRVVPLPELPPRCASCGGVQRPAIVWFGEVLPQDVFAAAVDAARSCDLFLVVGTSAVVQPAASLAMLASDAGAQVWEVNPERTPLTGLVDRTWQSPAGEAMDEVVEEALRWTSGAGSR